jgi:hypothetical protein
MRCGLAKLFTREGAQAAIVLIGWPRGESDRHWYCIGNARPLDQALQHATTEMLAMLTKDYGLTASEASLLLSQAVEYEVANVSTPLTASFVKFQKPCYPCYKRTVYLTIMQPNCRSASGSSTRTDREGLAVAIMI